MSEERESFIIEDKTYYIDELSDETKTRLSLFQAADIAIKEYTAKINLNMYAKDALFEQIKNDVGHDGNKDT